MGLGSAKTFNLAEARERNRKLVRQKLADGLDPVVIRRADRAARQANAAKTMTFAEATRHFLEQHSSKWESLKHGSQWENPLRTYAEPVIGALPIADIDVPLVLKVLDHPVQAERTYPAGPLWIARPETANRLRGRIEAVLDWLRPAAIAPATIPQPGKSSERSSPRAAARNITPPCPTRQFLPFMAKTEGNVEVFRPKRWLSRKCSVRIR